MPELLQQLKIYPYDGSFDASKHPALISPSGVVDADNIVYTNYSTKKLRPGKTDFFGDGESNNRHILYGKDFWRLGERRFVFYDGLSLKSRTSDGVEDNIAQNLDLPLDAACSMTVLSGLIIVFFDDGETPPLKWTMTGAASVFSGTATYSPFGQVFLNCLWIIDPDVPGRLLKSSTTDITDFSGGDAQTIDIDVNDGDPSGITAIFPPLYGNLYVSKRLSLYKISPQYDSNGDLFFSFLKISNGIGCISHNAVVAAEGVIFFPSDRGIHVLESSDKISGIDTAFLSQEIQPLWVNETNFNRAQYMQGVYDTELNSYLLLYPQYGRNLPDSIWGYSLSAAKWYRWQGYGANSIFTYIDPADKRRRTMLGESSGRFGYIDTTVTRDYGAKYGCSIQSGIIAPEGAPNANFLFYSITPIFVPQATGKFFITYKINGATIEQLEISMVSSADIGDNLGEEFIVGGSFLGGVPAVVSDTINIHGSGCFIQMLIDYTPSQNSDDFEDFELLGILIDADKITRNTGREQA